MNQHNRHRQRNGVVELLIGGENPVKIGNIKEQPYLQELVGGDEPILDFMTSAVQNTNLLTDMALRNQATSNAVFELVDLGLATITRKPISGTNVVRFKVEPDPKNEKDNLTNAEKNQLKKAVEGIEQASQEARGKK